MIDDPISSTLEGTVTITMSLDDAMVLRNFVGSLCHNDFAKRLTHRNAMHPRCEQVTGKVFRVLRTPDPYPQSDSGSRTRTEP